MKTRLQLSGRIAGLLLIAISLARVGDALAAGEGTASWNGGPGYRTWVAGDESLRTTAPVTGGWLLCGGGQWDYAAFRWFVEHAGHGHLLVLSASGGTETQDELYAKVSGMASVRTIQFSHRRAAGDPRVLEAVRNADGVFVAGGDQSRYVRMWRDTPLARAVAAHVRAGKPLGGTSAGLAIMGAWLYGAMDGGSIDSTQALADPLGKAVTLEPDLLHNGLLQNLLTDSHFDKRERLGRLIAFLAKARSLDPARAPGTARELLGFGIDEEAAVTVEPDGEAKVHEHVPGSHAWLVRLPATIDARTGHALEVSGVQVTGVDTASHFNLRTLIVSTPAFERTYDVVQGHLQQRPHWSLAIHGGAGVIDRGALTPELEAAYRAGLQSALVAGQKVLAQGGSAVDAVQAAVVVLEDDPHFNAGKGAAIAADGNVYLDAALMDGRLARAGAVAALTRTRNPILAARAVMEKTPHVLLAGAGADAFSLQQGLAQEDPAYFHTPAREQMFRDWQQRGTAALSRTHIYGTVGAVALDSDGHLAAATSTGGLTGKQWGRVGDSPLIGAGTYARDGQCAVSATGTGEYFIRDSAARQVCDRIRWDHEDLATAARNTILSVGALGGDGALIAIDTAGDVSFAINDLGMYRGKVSSAQPAPVTAIYAEETPR